MNPLNPGDLMVYPVTFSATLKRLVLPTVFVAIALGIVTSLADHGQSLLQAAGQLVGPALIFSFFLCIVHRVLNATGWGLVLRATGEHIDSIAAARVWLASESCRWLPGSVWAYGSRTLLASRCGIPTRIAAVSLLLEILVTIAGWLLASSVGWSELRAWRLETVARLSNHTQTTWSIDPLVAAAIGGAAAVLTCFLMCRSNRVRVRLKGLASEVAELRRMKFDLWGLAAAVLFYAFMAVFNGLAFLLIIRSEPAGTAVTAQMAIAANAVAWLVGFFALFAPGGLVVREACLVALLSPWMPPNVALVVSLAWRFVQMSAELLCSLVVAIWGLPRSIVKDGRVVEQITYSR